METLDTRAPYAPEPTKHHVDMMFRQVPGAFWATDRDLRITSAHGRVLALKGIPPESVVGMTFQEFVGATSDTDPATASHYAALQGRAQRLDYSFAGRILDICVEPLRADDGAIIGCVGTAIDTTDRRRVDGELAQRTRQLEEAQRVAHVGSFEWDAHNDRFTWSDELRRVYGIEDGSGISSTGFEEFLARVHPDDLGMTRSAFYGAVRSLHAFAFDHRIVRPNDGVRYLHTVGDVIPDDAGGASRIVGSCWDVTATTHAVDLRKRALSLLEATLNATADGILVVDRFGKVTVHNEPFVRLWGIPPALSEQRDDDALLAFILDRVDGPDEFMRRVRELYASPEDESLDIVRFKDGRIIERTSVPQRLGTNVVGRVWTFRDVTERASALERANLLVDATRLLASLDVEHALEAIARLAVPTLGDGCSVDLVVDGESRRVAVVEPQQALLARHVPPAPVRAGSPTRYRFGGRELMGIPIVVKNAVAGTVTFLARFQRHFSDRDLQLAEELCRRAALSIENALLYRQIEAAVGARDELLAIAAHEIRGPIASMHLAVQSLRASGRVEAAVRDPAATARLLAIVERDERRLTAFVEQLLDVTRIRFGHLSFDLAIVDLAEVTRDVVSRMSAELTRAAIPLTIATEGAVLGQWDRFRLDQIVTNLLSNAIKFGAGKPIDVAVSAADGRARLVVTDRGVGIPPDMHDLIFAPFERAVPLRHFGGLGLGLYIARVIVERLGGTIQVASEPGRGSTFTVELPQERET